MISIGPIKDLHEWAAKARDQIDGRPLVVSISGGKDSTAVGLLLKEAGIPFKAIHMDTGWEDPRTEDYVRKYLPGVLGVGIEILGYPGGMDALVKSKGMFPSRTIRFCTEELKAKPAGVYLKTLIDDGLDPINVIGIRHEEGTSGNGRGQAKEWDYSRSYDCSIWRPIVEWTLEDVISIHTALGVRPNPLYLTGSKRVGCWPCIFVSKSEMRSISQTSPERIEKMRQMEADVGDQAERREVRRTKAALDTLARGGDATRAMTAAGSIYRASRSTLNRMMQRISSFRDGSIRTPLDGWNRPTWFQTRTPARIATNEWRCKARGCGARFTGTQEAPFQGRNTLSALDVALWLQPPEETERPFLDNLTHKKGCHRPGYSRHFKREGTPWDIDRVVDWSHTQRGSSGDVSDDLFLAGEHERGCTQWGLCDVPVDGPSFQEWVEGPSTPEEN